MKFSIFEKGFGLVDVLIGTALMLIIFLGISGAYQLGLKVINQSKNRITATAIANQQIEMIRNLSYENVGIIDGALPTPTGVLASTTTTTLNGVEYVIERNIKYTWDEIDGYEESEDDSCYLDYKTVETKVSWSGRFGGEVRLVTDITPKNIVQEIASCVAQPGGLLSVKVIDASSIMVADPLIEIFDSGTGESFGPYMPSTGEVNIPLTTSTYKVVVSKTDYNIARSYGTNEVANPENECHARPHPIVLEGLLTPVIFCIDKVSTFSIDTLSPWGVGNFADSFFDETKISEKENVEVLGGEVNLATSTEGYLDSGHLISISTVPVGLISWDEFSFTDSEPVNTNLSYQIFYASGTEWYLIPDADLAGNSAGFDNSPVDISGLNITTYPQLKLKANASSSATSSTPVLEDWQVSWIVSEATPIPSATFNLRGTKQIGTDGIDDPVYKYSTTTNSDSGGHIDIPDLEWGSYIFTAGGTDLDLVDIYPSSTSIYLSPDTNQPVILYLEAENSLLVTVLSNDTGEPVFDASVRLYKTDLSYDVTQYTNDKGQTYFIPLEAVSYNLEIQAYNYSDLDTTVSISGDNTKLIALDTHEE